MPDATPNSAIVMTGGTSGFGLIALRMVAANTTTPVIVGARDTNKLPNDLRDRVTVLPLDLASRQSVATFCLDVAKHGPIGHLVLNAGLSPRKLETTSDGYDRAFQVNYLATFELVYRLWDTLTPEAHIIITSSGTHDPDEKTPPPPPRHANVAMLANPTSDPDLDKMATRAAARSYTASKLCCTMLSLELASRRPMGTSISFDPGLVPGTSLTREFPQWLVKLLIPIMSRTMPADRTSTMSASATALAYLMVGRSLTGRNGDYLAMRGGYPMATHPSKLARNDKERTTLWLDSEDLLGLRLNGGDTTKAAWDTQSRDFPRNAAR